MKKIQEISWFTIKMLWAIVRVHNHIRSKVFSLRMTWSRGPWTCLWFLICHMTGNPKTLFKNVAQSLNKNYTKSFEMYK